jgi:hypothetical protein
VSGELRAHPEAQEAGNEGHDLNKLFYILLFFCWDFGAELRLIMEN